MIKKENMTNLEYAQAVQSLTEINNNKFKWVGWWNTWMIIESELEYKEHDALISVQDKRIYFADGSTSEVFPDNDSAMIAATALFNTAH